MRRPSSTRCVAGTAAKQKCSWFSLNRSSAKNPLVAQIYFPTDSPHLDEDDRKQLKKLAQEFALHILGNRVRLTFHGHADFRASEKHNMQLSQHRAEAVRNFVDTFLGNMANYSSQIKYSGERYANKGDLASDRRVDVISSYMPPPPRKKIKLPPIIIEGKRPAKMKSVPVAFIRKTFTVENPNEKAISHVVIYEKYEDVPEDFEPIGIYTGETLYEWKTPWWFVFGRSSIEIKRGTIKYKQKGAATKTRTVFNFVGEFLRAGKGEVEDIVEQHKSWKDYPKNKGDTLEKFRP